MDLQALIDAQTPNSTLELPPGEFFGQVTMDRPLTVVGRGKPTWIGSRVAPTIRITSAGVRLQNLMVENTESSDVVAIEASSGTSPILENVVIHGALIGIPPENLRDELVENNGPPIPISFLPPPPLSAPDSDNSPSPFSSVAPASRGGQPSPAGAELQTSASKGNVDVAPLQPGKHNPTPSTVHSSLTPLKLILAVALMLIGIVAVTQQLEKRNLSSKQTEELERQLKQADADKRLMAQEMERLKAAASRKDQEARRLGHEIDDLKTIVSQLKSESGALRVTNARAQQTIESLQEYQRRLEKENARLKKPAQQSTYSSQDLISAAMSGDTERVRRLLDAGVAADGTDSAGWTALMRAAGHGRIYVVQLLLNRGAHVNATAQGGTTALIAAAAGCHGAVVSELLNRGADRTRQDISRLTAADYARKLKCADQLAKLLQP